MSEVETTPAVADTPVELLVLNHTSGDYGKWVSYNGAHFTDLYQLRTKEGEEYAMGYPQYVVVPNAEDPSQKQLELVWHCLREIPEPPETTDPDATVPVVPKVEEKPTKVADGEVAEIALLQRTPKNQHFFPSHYDDISRRRRAVMEVMSSRRFALSPEEDLTAIRAKSVMAQYLDVILGDEKDPIFTHRVDIKGQQFTPHEDGTWSLELDTEFTSNHATDFGKDLQLVAQVGGQFKLGFQVKVTTTELDVLARGYPEKLQLELVKPGRNKKWHDVLVKAIQEQGVHCVVRYTRKYHEEYKLNDVQH